MKKIDLTPYTLGEQEVSVKNSIVMLLFNPSLKLSARDLIAQDALAKKIEASEGSILLEASEYIKVKNAFESFTGFGRGDLELINRVLNAEDVKVKEA